MPSMNPFLENLFDVIAVDTEHLNSYLTLDEWEYLNNALNSREDLASDFYSDSVSENLEVLLHFLLCHAEDIALILEDNSKKDILLKLYTSSTISGNYECFRFDLAKFDQTYNPKGHILTLYRIGREDEHKESLGNSWAQDIAGLKAYALASSINVNTRPQFVIKINDSEVLCEGNLQENELILKKGFKFNDFKSYNFEKLCLIPV